MKTRIDIIYVLKKLIVHIKTKLIKSIYMISKKQALTKALLSHLYM